MAVTLLEKVASLLKTIFEGYSEYLKYVLNLRNELLELGRKHPMLIRLAVGMVKTKGLNLALDKQEKFGSKPHDFYNYLRDVFEDFNIL